MDRKDLEMEKDAAFPEESGTEGADYGELLKTVPGYQSQYAGQIQDMYNQISQRQPFNYDVNADAMYQALKDQYVTGGRMAMMDTMGQAATLTGGYGNSYAQNVGQQAYQGYLQGLNEQIPDLYNQALQNYIAEGDRMLQNYGMLQDMDQNAYGQYMDRMELVQPQVLAMLEMGIRPSQEMLDASGLSQEYIDAMYPEKTAGGWTPGNYQPQPKSLAEMALETGNLEEAIANLHDFYDANMINKADFEKYMTIAHQTLPSLGKEYANVRNK